ncbi:Proliferating cell nuclear antigen [Spironucleus salmonicida]|uniref:DNA sliding clamp PCNA n=1 Tax=Spironucleus salmonicida TaxID=348837 RepID=V6LBE1_9EUKA|nr:Proliferating cell nuclear antigen [Spironucleus salmonicida]|eukprot:EST41770.1 Proliferating cell nuclear antigen [Spironucleus salmonicida]
MVDTINFQICFPEANTLKKILDTISGLMKDCVFNITPNGLFVDAVDETRICLVSLALPDTYFSQFRCNQATQISLRLASFVKLIKFCDTNDTVTLSQRSSQPDQIEILVESQKFRQTMNFVLRLTRADSEQLSADKFAPDSVISLNSSRFATLVRDLSALGSVVRISSSSSDSTAIFEVTGEESNAAITVGNAKDDGEGGASISVKQDVDLKFTLRYFILFSKAASLANDVRIELAGGSPAVVCYEFGDGGKIQFLLACSVDGDEEEEPLDEADAGDDI